MTREDLRALWTARRETFARTGAYVQGSRIIDEFLADAAKVDDDEQEILLTLSAASPRCGYSAEHLGRLVREGRIPNYGRKGAPRVRVADLPLRKFARTRTRSYDVNADARTLKNGRQ